MLGLPGAGLPGAGPPDAPQPAPAGRHRRLPIRRYPRLALHPLHIH